MSKVLNKLASSMLHWDKGPSQLDRIAACPPSVEFIKLHGLVSKESPEAAEGTLAHDWAAKSARFVFQGTGTKPIAYPNPEIRDACLNWCEEIAKRLCSCPPASLRFWIEEPLDFTGVAPPGEKGAKGTADLICYCGSCCQLIVADFKYGAGVKVSIVKNGELNKQLMGYGAGFMLNNAGTAFSNVRLLVVQPRAPYGATAEHQDVDPFEVDEFIEQYRGFVRRTLDKSLPFAVGDHCRFCAAAPRCPERQRETHAASLAKFEDLSTYDPAEVARFLDSAARVKDFLGQLESWVYSEAAKGVKFPGYKLVNKHPGHRKWRDDIEDLEYELQNLAPEDLVFEIHSTPKLKSPAQIEEELKRIGIKPKSKREELVNALTERESSGTCLAPESDERPAVGPREPTFDELPDASDAVEDPL